MLPEMSFAAHPDLQRAIIFHGHFCPGLAIGYRAALVGLTLLDGSAAENDELVAIVENGCCAVDAIQAIAGCTFGKGSLLVRDHGKDVYTFVLRSAGRGLRLSLRFPASEFGMEQLCEERINWLMDAEASQVFDIQAATVALPARREDQASVACQQCGEQVGP